MAVLQDGKARADLGQDRIRNGEYILHNDAAWDLGLGGGDDNTCVCLSYDDLTESLLPGVPNSDPHPALTRAEHHHREMYKIIEGAFEDEPQDMVEVFSRFHHAPSDTHFPKPARWLQKTILIHLNKKPETTGLDAPAPWGFVLLNGADYAQIATSLLERARNAKQLPVFR